MKVPTFIASKVIIRSTMVIAMLGLVQFATAQQRDQKLSAGSTTPLTTSSRAGIADATADQGMSANTLTHRIIDAPNGTFGYELLLEGKLFVRQTSIPGRAGVEGCPTRQHAEDLAALVERKIASGTMPPTVSDEELRSLGL